MKKRNLATAIKTGLACAIVASLTACASMGTEAVNDPAKLGQMKVGVTAKAEIYEKYGQPHDVFDYLGRRGWRYIHASSSPEPVTFVLGVLIWPLIAMQQTDFDVSQTDFFFDDNGRLLDSTTRKSQLRKSLLSAGDAFTDKQKASVERVRLEMESIGVSFDKKAADQSLAYLAI